MNDAGTYFPTRELDAAGQVGEPSPGTWPALWIGMRWAAGSWPLVACLFLVDVVLTALAAIPGQALILSAFQDRPTEALFGLGWRVEMLAELLIRQRHGFVAAAWVVIAAFLVSWVAFALLWAGVVRAWSQGRRSLASVLAGASERGLPVLALRLVGLVVVGVALLIVRLALSGSVGASFWVRVALVVPTLLLLIVVHGVVTYWWMAAALGDERKRWFLGPLAEAWRAVFAWSGRGLQVHLLFLLAWGGLAWASVMALDPGRTWSWPVWILVVVVELGAASRLWLYAAALVSQAAVLRDGGAVPGEVVRHG